MRLESREPRPQEGASRARYSNDAEYREREKARSLANSRAAREVLPMRHDPAVVARVAEHLCARGQGEAAP